ncbi:MAG: hypothetical protein LBV30_10380, partial [Propionibacteriaceae bacterium]|nr:hypothetical protein [Propionibacteriaceae bacterium]
MKDLGVWFDAPTWVHDRLTAGLPQWQVLAERNANDRGSYPSLVWSLIVSKGRSPGLWSGNLALTLDMPAGDAATLARQ